MSSSVIHVLNRLDLHCVNWRWPFADFRRVEIDAHFAQRRIDKPLLYNGRVLLGRSPRFDGAHFAADFFETDFASFLAWRDWGFPDSDVFNIFGMGALRGADGGYLLGEMAAHTANAGRVYFPGGTPDLDDVRGDRLDLAASVEREVAEETGLTPSDYRVAAEWICVASGSSLALMRTLDLAMSAVSARDRILSNLAGQTLAELRDIHVVRNIADLTQATPSYVVSFLAHAFR